MLPETQPTGKTTKQKPTEPLFVAKDAPMCLRCAKRCLASDFVTEVQFCKGCNSDFLEYKQSHFQQRPRIALGNKVNTQGKLMNFFSSKKKGTERIEIDSDNDDSDYHEKSGKKPRASTVGRFSSISLSQGDVLPVAKKTLSKSTKRQRSRRRPFSVTKKRNDILKIS